MSLPQDGILGSYRLLEQVGQGGMGVVYRAQHLRLGREAAVKLLPVNLASEPDFLKRFEREAASAASLTHPNILAVWEYGDQNGAPYLVMPYIAGGTLKDQLARVKDELKDEIAHLGTALRAEMEILRRDVTIRFGSMLVVATAVLLAAKFFG